MITECVQACAVLWSAACTEYIISQCFRWHFIVNKIHVHGNYFSMISNFKVRLFETYQLSLITACFAPSTFYLPEVVVTRDIFYSPYCDVNCWNSSDKYNCPITPKNIRVCSTKVKCYINSFIIG